MKERTPRKEVVPIATKKKYKKLNNKEKQLNKEFREEMRERGILPPIKPKLNRKKFAQEVREEWEKEGSLYYLPRALGCMIPSGEFETKITPEQIGVLKVMKLAIEIKRFEEQNKAEGKSDYTIGELYEKAIAPILNL
ncbi:hypothetical protein KQI38_09385 [Tissierella carlieri]|uniref:hypothetical protein n=1 Tax=Tissierella carlieri TaxID=689904 RepID=UPI001C1197F0|nr:hypothetical protein [Tissierella carlieri]MBU5312239.1 hypothetical protein [Tissierella carlieri]